MERESVADGSYCGSPNRNTLGRARYAKSRCDHARGDLAPAADGRPGAAAPPAAVADLTRTAREGSAPRI